MKFNNDIQNILHLNNQRCCSFGDAIVSKRRGNTMVTVLVMLPVLFILAAMAINLSHIQAVNTKTQMVTDAATRAAGIVYASTESKTAAVAEAQSIAAANAIEGITLTLAPSDFQFGVSVRSAPDQPYTFTPAEIGNSVRLSTNSFAAGAGPALKPAFGVYGQDSDIRPVCKATHTQMALDVAIVVDRSGSMNFAADEDSEAGVPPATAPAGWSYSGPAPPNSRWLDLVVAVKGFCDELADTVKIEMAALCSYHSTTSTNVLLTRDYQSIRNELDYISQDFDGLATNVGDGILEGIAAVEDASRSREWASKVIVLMSDGRHNIGTDPLTAVDEAVAKSIPIYTVSFSDEADILLMQDVANLTGGTHYHATNASELNAAFREIARNLPSLLTQ